MKLSLIVGLLVSLASGASAQVLGESKGQGSMTYALEMFNGETKNYSGTCKVAMNINQSSTALALEFSVFECQYLGAWNDPVLQVFVKDGQLVNKKGQVVGQVYADGTFKFTTKSTVVHKYSYTDIDANCAIRGVVQKKLNFNTELTYTFRALGNGQYVGTRVEQQDKMAWGTHKPYKRCSGVTVPVKQDSLSRIHFTVQ